MWKLHFVVVIVVVAAAVDALVDSGDVGGCADAGPAGASSNAVPGEELFHVGEDVVAEHHGLARDEEAVELVVGEELAGGGGGGVVGEEAGGAEVGPCTICFMIILLVEG